MEKVKEQGLAKSIGVSNFLERHVNAILNTAKHVPVINQIEFHPYLQHQPLVKHCKQNGIAISAYGPQVPVTAAKGGPVDEYLADLAKKYGVSEGDVLLRWCIDQDIAVITTSSKEERLIDYLRVAQFRLTEEEVRTLGELGDQKHYRRFWTNKYDPEDRS
jgi:diketogulonate reductase-like aldo/keto reductase